MAWPRLPSGAPALDEDTFRQQARLHASLEPLRQLRSTLGQLRLNSLAVGGDGTACEIVNGLFPEALDGERPLLGFLPLGTGNSFLDVANQKFNFTRGSVGLVLQF